MELFSNKKIYGAVLLIFILSISEKAAALKCYECDSITDELCYSPNSTLITECHQTISILRCLENEFLKMSKEMQKKLGIFEKCSEFVQEKGINGTFIRNDTKEHEAENRIPIKSFYCRKIITSIYGIYETQRGDALNTKKQIKERISRSCGFLDSEKDDTKGDSSYCQRRRNGGSLQTICSCKEDKCNGQSPTVLNAIYLIFCLVLVKIVEKSL